MWSYNYNNLFFYIFSMTWLNIENLKKAGLNTTEISEVKESIEDFEKNQISYDFENVKEEAKKKLFSKEENYV